MNVVIIIVVDTKCFRSKVIGYVLQYFSFRYLISVLKYFSEQILVALARSLLNMLVTVLEGIQECGLICMFVIFYFYMKKV